MSDKEGWNWWIGQLVHADRKTWPWELRTIIKIYGNYPINKKDIMKKLIGLVLLLVGLCSCGTLVVDDDMPTVETVVMYGRPYYYDNQLTYYYYNGYYYYPYKVSGRRYYHRYDRPVRPHADAPRYHRPSIHRRDNTPTRPRNNNGHRRH